MAYGYDVFLSHSTAAPDWSRDFARELRDQGLSVFFDVEAVRPGAPVEETVRTSLQNSGSVVVVLDPSSSSSRWTAFEVGAALGMGKRVVSVVSSDVSFDALPPAIRSAPYVVMTTPEESAKQVAHLLSSRSTGP